VLDSTMPDHGTGGTVAASLVSAQTAANPPVPITVGVQTDSLGNLGKIFPMPPPQEQPPLGQLPQQPPVLTGATMSVINRSWSATDDCGNRSTCVQQITVRDTTGPVITASDLVLDCPADTSTNATGVAVAQDACTSVMLLSYSDVVSNGCGGAKVVSRTWTAVDSNGNTNTAVQTITVRNPAPTLTCPPDLVIECPADTSTNTTGVAVAQDACSPATVSYTDTVSNICGGATITLRTWTATDACGTSTSCVQTIAVRDTTPPTIACHPSRTVGATNSWA